MAEGRGEGKYGSTRGDNEAQMQFIVAIAAEGPPMVLIDFRRMVDHVHLSPREAREWGEGLIDAAKEAEVGSSILRVKPLNGG